MSHHERVSMCRLCNLPPLDTFSHIYNITRLNHEVAKFHVPKVFDLFRHIGYHFVRGGP